MLSQAAFIESLIYFIHSSELNISINAVSIALNDKEGVSTELRMQILEAATEMNYPFKKLNVKDTLKNKTLVVIIEDKKEMIFIIISIY